MLQHKLKDKRRVHSGKIKVEEGEDGMETGDNNSALGSETESGLGSGKVIRDVGSLSVRRPRISNKGDVSEVSEAALEGE